MSKFKIGDKVKCIDGTYKDTLILTVSHIEPDEDGNSKYDLLGFTEDGHVRGEWYAYHFEIVKEKEEMQFDMKKSPWFIRVNNKEEFEAAKEWVDSQGIVWTDWVKDKGFNSEIGGLCSNLHNLDNYYWLSHEETESSESLYGREEIKITFKTIIDSVEYPTIETEQDKKIKELQETIEKAQQQITELKGLK